METDDFDIEQYAALAQETTDDVQVELDEKDLQDPTLLVRDTRSSSKQMHNNTKDVTLECIGAAWRTRQ